MQTLALFHARCINIAEALVRPLYHTIFWYQSTEIVPFPSLPTMISLTSLLLVDFPLPGRSPSQVEHQQADSSTTHSTCPTGISYILTRPNSGNTGCCTTAASLCPAVSLQFSLPCSIGTGTDQHILCLNRCPTGNGMPIFSSCRHSQSLS